MTAYLNSVVQAGFTNAHPISLPIPYGLSRGFWIIVYIVSPLVSLDASAKRKLEKAVFLLAVASGTRILQLCALMCFPACIVFAPDGSQVFLAPPAFLAKNEPEGHHLFPFMIRS